MSRERKQEGNLGANKRLSRSDNGGIENLPDDVLINILSHLSLYGAARTSVLARRWRSLWRFSHGTLLQFDQWDNNTATDVKEFESWVNTVLKDHQDQHIGGIVVNLDAKKRWASCSLVKLMCFASHKEVQMLEIKLPEYNVYEFPRIERSISLPKGVASPFRHLRTLRLAHVDINDDEVHYFLVLCLNLEELSIQSSSLLENIQVVDPPSLRVLEISECYSIQTLEISAVNLVSLTYGGWENSLLMKNVPNFRELTMVGDLCLSLVEEPMKNSLDLGQLEKLVLDIRKLAGEVYTRIVASHNLPQLGSLRRLEVKVYTLLGRRLLFTSLIKGSPHLREFRIELSYSRSPRRSIFGGSAAFPGIISKVGKFVHRNLKVVEMVGYIGCRCAEGLLLELMKKCPSIERVVIDTQSDYYETEDDPYIECRRGKELKYGRSRGRAVTTRDEAKERAKRFVSNIPKPIKVFVS